MTDGTLLSEYTHSEMLIMLLISSLTLHLIACLHNYGIGDLAEITEMMQLSFAV